MEKIYRYLKYGFEEIFTKMLLTDKSDVSMKKRMDLIECLFTDEELKKLPKVVVAAYAESLDKVRQRYYFYKR